MTRLASGFTAIVGTLMLVGCDTSDRVDAYDKAVLGDEFAVDLEAFALPDGHPPVFQGHQGLPPGHPPLSGVRPRLPEGHPALPEGHPRCPADGLMLERPVEEHWHDSIVAAPSLISI